MNTKDATIACQILLDDKLPTYRDKIFAAHAQKVGEVFENGECLTKEILTFQDGSKIIFENKMHEQASD